MLCFADDGAAHGEHEVVTAYEEDDAARIDEDGTSADADAVGRRVPARETAARRELIAAASLRGRRRGRRRGEGERRCRG